MKSIQLIGAGEEFSALSELEPVTLIDPLFGAGEEEAKEESLFRIIAPAFLLIIGIPTAIWFADKQSTQLIRGR